MSESDEPPAAGRGPAGPGEGSAARPDGGPAARERATVGTRVLGFALFAGAIAAVARVAAEGTGGDWRSGVIVGGLAGSLALGGLAMNGWLTRLVNRLLWIFPATLLFLGTVLLADPGYGAFLNGDAERGRVESDGQAIGLGVIFLLIGVAGLAGYGFAVRNRVFRAR
ncbi:hypothetical protein [Actinomadura sp. WMMB 499]|uniref:hypothetical protein n=1 Tax=Actinomadura sp. WMMB 499 TaxID=1219491 RepID=UPI0012466035|nr:hypothetical protein [Actinomadura sp. WMMB 499]QFG21547.1 hypothetical protein F7P10_10795 [Actinomadura sp. WMMB 499]